MDSCQQAEHTTVSGTGSHRPLKWTSLFRGLSAHSVWAQEHSPERQLTRTIARPERQVLPPRPSGEQMLQLDSSLRRESFSFLGFLVFHSWRGSPEIFQSGSLSPARKQLSPQLVLNVSAEPSGKPGGGSWGGEKTAS